MKIEFINNVKIKPVITNQDGWNSKTVRGYDYYTNPYSNVCLLARKNSGKSTVIYRALEQCVAKGTNVFIFSPTVHMDATYKKMIAMLKKKKCNVIAKEHFIENGVDLIQEILAVINNKEDEEMDEKTELPTPPLLNFGDPRFQEVNRCSNGECTLVPRSIKKEKKVKKKSQRGKLITPESIFVFDDLSSVLRHKSISQLMTKNRHYKLKTFLACHSVNNLDKMALSCIDVFHVFANVSNEKIEELREKVNITFKNDSKKKDSKLQQIYDMATAGRYNFLYIDRINDCYRRNFNERILIEE